VLANIALLPEPGGHPIAGHPDDKGGNADASANDHAGPNGGGGEFGEIKSAPDRLKEGRCPELAQGLGDLRRQAAQQAGEGASAQFGDRLFEEGLVGEGAQNVGDGEAGGEGQLHSIDQNGSVEHADADAEHPDGGKEQDELPDRRFLESEPDHGLDEDGHAGHVGDGGGHGLDVIGAVLALGAVAVSDDAAEDASEDLATDEEADGEVHVGGGDGAQRS